MFNDFKGFNKSGKPIKISIPPTLLISSIGVVDKISHLTKITPNTDDQLFLLGNTYNELTKSEYEKVIGNKKTKIPSVNAKLALKTYKAFEKANKLKIFSSAIGVDIGGLGIAVTKISIASKKGLLVDLETWNKNSIDQFLFSETQSRILVSIKKNNIEKFKKIFHKIYYIRIGKCTNSDKIEFKNGKKIISDKISNFEKSYKKKIRGL